MTDNVTMAVHLVNSASLPHFLSAAAAADHHTHRGGHHHHRNARPLSSYSASTFHRRPNSFESLNSSSSEYEYDWSNMDQIVQEQMQENDIIKRSKLPASPALEKDVDDEEIDEAVSVTTQQEVEWFKSLGLDAVLAKVFDGTNEKPDDLELATHYTKSQADTIRRRLASLQGTLSRASSRQIAEVLSRTSSDLDIVADASHEVPIRKTIVKPSRDVRDVFKPKNERRSSSSSDDTDTASPKLHRSTDSVDSASVEQKLSDIYPENYRPGYCLTQPLEAVTKQRSPPRRWRTPLGGQAAADIVGIDQETGVKTLKINYLPNSGYDTKVPLEQPPPVVWPKGTSGGMVNGEKTVGQDLQLEFAFKLHPAERPDTEWPNVIMRNCPSGIASIDDLLWEADMQSVKQLALIETTQIFDRYHLMLSKRRQKPKKKIKNSPETAVFGSSLDRLVALDNNRHGRALGCSRPSTLDVPVVFQQMLNYLEESGGIGEEGILRLCGETNRMRRLRGELDSYYSRQVVAQDESSASLDEAQWFRRIFQTVSVHDIASVMKQFLRDLPQPLLTNELVDAFAQISEIPDRITQIQALNLLVLQLPPAERATLKALLRFLRKTMEAEKSNKMSSANIALIIAPNIFHPKVKTGSPISSQNFPLLNSNEQKRADDATKQFDLVARLSVITRIMIVYSPYLFVLPPSFLQQIRTKHATDLSKVEKKTKEKRINRLDPRKIRSKPAKTLPVLPEADKTDSTFFQQQFPTEPSSAVIRVRLGRRNSGDGEHPNQKVSTAVQVTPGLTAGDVVAKFLPTSSLASSPEISTSTEPLNLSTSSGVSGSDKSSSSSNENLLEIDSGRSIGGSIAEKREHEPPVSLHTHFLVEQGGNIGLRRLDHNVSMLAAYRANPTAVWIVKYFAHV
ncbi:rho GTPase-activating protein 40-like [Paramacrobiotus metropolitanus]|uniref:rho GTPase-activating protein 40-like n=1 Tax=Paramacrobiotus metropolitanus TaxID=2943436 RepID=UPI00244566FD|nr:rho GTPase-activating protein 40-like [Paramacrobiotus metropolitanus]XP_055347806.1 rho GTPase-activating protein 40-like [Paramacrobiotus metropolitanus]XP_055347814.1 rho GTPase-activating protein 40-like [Paramacrobiotus metropolitanus]